MYLLGLVANKEIDRVFLVGHGDFLQQTVSSLIGPSGGSHDPHCKPSAALISRNTSLTNVYVTESGGYLLGASNSIPHLVNKEPELMTGGHPVNDGWERTVKLDVSNPLEIIIHENMSDIPKSTWSDIVSLREAYLFVEDGTTIDEYYESDRANTTIHFIATQMNHNIGYAQLSLSKGDGSESGYEGRVQQVITHPAFRGKGVGKALLMSLMNKAKASKCSALTVRTWMASESFYLSQGFSRRGGADDNYESKGKVCVHMRKELAFGADA